MKKTAILKFKRNKKYSICSCGLTKKNPFCDNSHREFNKNNNCSYKSVKILLNDNDNLELFCNNWNFEDENI